jgi:hypothetical protein
MKEKVVIKVVKKMTVQISFLLLKLFKPTINSRYLQDKTVQSKLHQNSHYIIRPISELHLSNIKEVNQQVIENKLQACEKILSLNNFILIL